MEAPRVHDPFGYQTPLPGSRPGPEHSNILPDGPPSGTRFPAGPPVYGTWGPDIGFTTEDERTWAMLAHLNFFVLFITPLLFFIAPLVIMYTKGKTSAFVKDQAVQALIFQVEFFILSILMAIVLIMSLLLGPFVLVMMLGAFAVTISGIWMAIQAAIAANHGEKARYPGISTKLW